MFLSKILAHLFNWPVPTPFAAVSYDDIFKSEASAPPVGALDSQWRTGLSPLSHDAYFKEVFAGPVF